MNQTGIQIFGKAVKIERAKEPSEYVWENMAYSSGQQRRNFWLVMIPFIIVLFFAYKLQFVMQRSISYFDNYEVFDCRLFHASSKSNRFSDEELRSANVDLNDVDESDLAQGQS